MALSDRSATYGRPGHAEYDETGGYAETGAVPRLITDHRELLEAAGLDPDSWEIIGKVGRWTKTHHNLPDTYSFYFQFSRKVDGMAAARDLAATIYPVKPHKSKNATGLPMVVNLADHQIGKAGADAPSHEVLDARFEAALAKVTAIVKERRPSTLIIADCGDPVENITSSAPNQAVSNTKDFPEQLRLWVRRLTQVVMSLYPYAGRVIVVSVPSNHGEVRNSEGKVGNGDYGISSARTVQDAFQVLGRYADVEFAFPETEWDWVTYVEVDDTWIAFTHGHHAKALDRIPQWVANQAAGLRSKMAKAKIVVHGHFHTPRYSESRGRAIVSCPMFDSGSPWFEAKTGEYSLPAIAVFSVLNERVHDLRFVTPDLAPVS